MKKMISLISVIAICLSLCVPAFAAEQNVEEEIFDLGGGVIAIVTVGKHDQTMPRTGVSGSGTARPTARQTYNLAASDGNFCRAQVWNEESVSSGNRIRVSCVVTLRGETQDLGSKDVPPVDSYGIRLSGANGSGLDGRIQFTITSLDSSSASYRYTIDQTWT